MALPPSKSYQRAVERYKAKGGAQSNRVLCAAKKIAQIAEEYNLSLYGYECAIEKSRQFLRVKAISDASET